MGDSLMLATILAVGCSHPGSQFLGKWVNKANANDSIEIVRNGNQYLLISGHDKLGATFRDGSLQVPTAMGTMTLTYIKSSDTLVGPGLFGQSEYQRAEEHGDPQSPAGSPQTPAGTLSTPAGTFSAGDTAVSPSDLGIDLYPGANQQKGAVRISTPKGSTVTAVFETSDSLDKVLSWYKDKLGSGASVYQSDKNAVLTLADDTKKTSVMVTISNEDNDGKTKIAIMHSVGS
jgi:hypothetical protein